MSISQSPELALWDFILCKWGKAEKGRNGRVDPEGHQQIKPANFESSACPCRVLQVINLLWVTLALLQFSNFYGTAVVVYRSVTVCMCQGVYHSVILAAWLKKTQPNKHQGLINITNGTNLFECQSSLGILSHCPMEQAVLVKEQFSLALPRAFSGFFLPVPFFVCAAKMAQVKPYQTQV